MNKITKYSIPILLAFLLVQPAFSIPGFKDMSGNMSDNNSGIQPESPIVFTESDHDIVILQYLIEVDSVMLKSQNELFVQETIIFKNEGTMNFNGTLRIWLPDGAEVAFQNENGEIFSENIIQRNSMMDGTVEYLIQTERSGNIMSWEDKINSKSIPPLIIIYYTIPAEPDQSINKKFLYPARLTKKPSTVILKLIAGEGDTISLTDENGNSLSASGNLQIEDKNVLYTWEKPYFNELNIELSKPAISQELAARYALPGIVILLVLSYLFFRKKSKKIQDMESKFKGLLKSEAAKKETEESAEEYAIPLNAGTAKSGRRNNKLEIQKREIESKISNLKAEYASGDLLDEEYEDLMSKYQKEADEIKRKIRKV